MTSKYGRRKFIKDAEFEEEKTWGAMEDSTPTQSNPRMIPKSTIVEPSQSQNKQFSAPIDIPDWPKIYGYKNNNTPNPSSSSWVQHHHDYDVDGEDEDEDENGRVVPPHEYLAKKLARSKISSFSVYEGAGRTLKGRYLSKVRNAVLTKTGFLES